MKDIIKMNKLAGLITENQARRMMEILDENPSKTKRHSKIMNEASTTFTLTYNTDPDDLDYVERLLRKAGIDLLKVEAGTFDDEVQITVDKDDLKKAIRALEADGFEV